MKPGKYNIKFYRATTLDITASWLIDSVPVNMDGYTGDMQVRVTPDSGTIVTEFTTENGGLVLNAVTGSIEITMAAEDTALLPLGQYQYDLNVTSPEGVVTKLLRGGFVVLDPVTE